VLPKSAAGDYRIEVELTTKDQVGAVIGENGQTINAIRKDAQVQIQIEPTDGSRASSTQRKVLISGDETGCKRAHARLLQVLRSNTGKRDYSQRIDEGGGGGVVRLTVPRHLVGRLIGKRGQTIKELREQTGAVIEIAKDDDGIGSVTLSGAPGRVQEARALIEELIEEELPIEVQQTLSRMLDEVVVISIPKSRVGKLIGSRGAVIQSLRQQSGATIDLQKDASGSASCTLRGSVEEMRAARQAIEQIVQGGG